MGAPSGRPLGTTYLFLSQGWESKRSVCERSEFTHRFRARGAWRQLLVSAGKLKVDSCVLIRFRRCSEVELIRWNVAGMRVPDVKRGRGQNVVMNLHRGSAIFEDERDPFRAFRARGRLRQIGSRRVRHTGPWLLLLRGPRIVSIGSCGSGVR